MRIGTKSILFGAHQFLLHPMFIAIAWFRLFGFHPVTWAWQTGQYMTIQWWNPMLWLCFITHDWGYWGKPNMDGEDGETHPRWAAYNVGVRIGYTFSRDYRWAWFLLLHSRHMARTHGRLPSPLAAADKLVTSITPWWVYVPLVRLTGEIREYQSVERHAEAGGFLGAPRQRTFQEDKEWFFTVSQNLDAWVGRFMEWNGGFREQQGSQYQTSAQEVRR